MMTREVESAIRPPGIFIVDDSSTYPEWLRLVIRER